jgi:hypothetical protein
MRDRGSHLGITVEKIPVILIQNQRDQFSVTLNENGVNDVWGEVGRVERDP